MGAVNIRKLKKVTTGSLDMVKSGAFACNAVADDLVWKDHVAKELRTAKQWPENWSFLTSAQANQDDDQECKTTTAKSGTKKERLKLPPINHAYRKKQNKNTKPFPQTTTGFVGWKSSEQENNLDIYGPYTRPVRTFLSQMKWPPEAVI